jgi:cell wall-associated NlpC family hydrolase
MSWANRYVGIPWKEKGRDWDGIDCWGTVYLPYKFERDIALPDYLDWYSTTDELQCIVEAIGQEKCGQWEKVFRLNEAQAFDVLVMRRGAYPSHVGLMVDYRHFLHITRNSDSYIERLDNVKMRIEGVYRRSV